MGVDGRKSAAHSFSVSSQSFESASTTYGCMQKLRRLRRGNVLSHVQKLLFSTKGVWVSNKELHGLKRPRFSKLHLLGFLSSLCRSYSCSSRFHRVAAPSFEMSCNRR